VANLTGVAAKEIKMAARLIETGISWQNEGGSALVPDNAKGRAWMAKADEIQAAGTEAEWDAHSLKLVAIGGEWN
jgi:hypothetical protein